MFDTHQIKAAPYLAVIDQPELDADQRRKHQNLA